MSWLSSVPVVLAAATLLYVPGFVVAIASRLRGLPLLAASPAITVTLIALSAVAAPVAGLRWSVVPVAIFTLAVALVAFVLSKYVVKGKARPQNALDWRAAGWQGVAVLVAAFIVGRRVTAVFGTPEAFSQTFDNVFHLNAIRYIEDSGSASSLTISSFTGGSFYPAAWHDLVSLLRVVTGSDIPLAVNAINLIVAALVWPIGCMLLARTVAGDRIAVTVAAGILAGAFGAFPLLLLDFGVLYPNFLGNALMPVAFTLGVRTLGVGIQKSGHRVIDGLLLLLILPGIALAHPSSVMALIVLLLPPMLFAWTRITWSLVRPAKKSWLPLAGMLAALLAAVPVLLLVWQKIRPPEEAAFWPPIESTGRAIGEVLTSSAVGRPVPWVVMILAFIGFVAIVLRRSCLWLLGTYLVAAYLYVVVASFPAGPFRMFVTGVWYNDPPRLASLLPLATLPLAAIGAVACWDRLAPAVARLALRNVSEAFSAGQPLHRRKGVTLVFPVVAAVAAAGMLAFGTQQENVREASNTAALGYQLNDDSPLVSADELALLKRLDSKVPADAVIADNPWNGSALAYAFSGRHVLLAHMHGQMPDGGDTIVDELNEAAKDPSVCPAVERLRVEYVLDFGHREVHGGDHGYDGLDNLAQAGVARLIDSEGEAKLYEITACQ